MATAPVALINTFHNDRVISRHRTIEAAEAANNRLQRATRKYNGSNCWVPTKIEVSYRYNMSRWHYGETLEARDFDDARQKLMLMISAEMIEEGHWGWVEDLDGTRFTVGDCP